MIFHTAAFRCSRNSPVGTVTRIQAGIPRNNCSILGISDSSVALVRERTIPRLIIYKASSLATGPTQPLLLKWVPGALPPPQWIKRPRREANHSPPSGTESKNGAIPPFHHTPSWRAQCVDCTRLTCIYFVTNWKLLSALLTICLKMT